MIPKEAIKICVEKIGVRFLTEPEAEALNCLIQAADRLAAYEEMMTEAGSINFPGELNMGETLIKLSTGWKFQLGDGSSYASPIEAFATLKGETNNGR